MTIQACKGLRMGSSTTLCVRWDSVCGLLSLWHCNTVLDYGGEHLESAYDVTHSGLQHSRIYIAIQYLSSYCRPIIIFDLNFTHRRSSRYHSRRRCQVIIGTFCKHYGEDKSNN